MSQWPTLMTEFRLLNSYINLDIKVDTNPKHLILFYGVRLVGHVNANG